MGIGKRLKTILYNKNISIAKLSNTSDVSLNTLYSITKRDPESIKLDTLKKIAFALNVTFNELLDEPVLEEHDVKPDAELILDLKKRGIYEIFQYLRNLGYDIKKLDGGIIILTLPDGLYPFTDDELISIGKESKNFIRFKINDLLDKCNISAGNSL